MKPWRAGSDGTAAAPQQASTGQMEAGKTHSLASDKDSVPSKGNNRNVCPQNPRLQGLGSGGGLGQMLRVNSPKTLTSQTLSWQDRENPAASSRVRSEDGARARTSKSARLN